MRRGGGFMTMEALALVSALCIAGILVYAHHARQTQALDLQALRLARETRPLVEAFFAANPGGRLTPSALADQGLSLPPELKLAVTELKDLRDDWRVEIWHPQGAKVFVLTPAGLAERPR
ncbi:MAG: hypothetical protein LDL11_02270 [Desulfarculus sp.]|nr:hypothetical protein [Desulfarculus sp.]